MAHYRWLLFDADGTLFDYDQAEAAALESTFRDFSLAFYPSTAEAYRRINHQTWLDFEKGLITSEALRVRRFELLFLDPQARIGEAACSPQAFSDRYLINLSRQAHLMPQAQPVVKTLAATYQMGIITNGLKDVQRPRLAISPLAPLFDLLAISEEIRAAKPAPAYFDAVFQLMGGPSRSEVLVIGDSLTSDIQGGINYGVDTCWFNPGGKAAPPEIRPTYTIQRLDELIPLLGG